MSNITQHLANPVAGKLDNALAISAPAQPRRRSISEILDVDRSFLGDFFELPGNDLGPQEHPVIGE